LANSTSVALKLSGDDHAIVIDLQIRLRRRLQQSPIVFVNLDKLLAKVVALVDSAKLLQALNAVVQSGWHVTSRRLRIEAQFAKILERLLEVAGGHLLLSFSEGGRF